MIWSHYSLSAKKLKPISTTLISLITLRWQRDASLTWSDIYLFYEYKRKHKVWFVSMVAIYQQPENADVEGDQCKLSSYFGNV